MSFRSVLLCCFIVASLAAGAAAVGEPVPIRLAAQPDIGPQLAAFPRLAAPGGPQMQRINQQLASADARARKAARECHLFSSQGPLAGLYDWQRSVTVAMR